MHRGTVLNINPAWTATLGLTLMIPLDSRRMAHHPDDREKSFGELVSLRAWSPQPEHFENSIQCKDGSLSMAVLALHWQIHRPDMPSLGTSLISSKPKRTPSSQLAQSSSSNYVWRHDPPIAHEIRQPLGVIAANAQAGLRWLQKVLS